MKISPEMVDYLIITAFEILKVLGKTSKGEPITDEDLKLESWEDTLKKVREGLV